MGALVSKLDMEIAGNIARRQKRGRRDGDGLGVDVGIIPGACIVPISKHIQGLSLETKKRLLEHVKHHVEEGLKPFVRLLERGGESDYNLDRFRSVGPNSFRTIIEQLEAEVND